MLISLITSEAGSAVHFLVISFFFLKIPKNGSFVFVSVHLHLHRRPEPANT